MRYSELKNKQEPVSEQSDLVEINMSPGSLLKQAQSIDALVGVEFEMIVPDLTVTSQEETESEPDWDQDGWVESGRGWSDEMISFFTHDGFNSRREVESAIEDLSGQYWEWMDDEFNKWMNNSDDAEDQAYEILRGLVDRDEDETDTEYQERLETIWRDIGDSKYYDEVQEQLRDYFNEEDRWEDFLKENRLERYSQIASEFELSWPYYTRSSEETVNQEFLELVDDFKNAVGRPATYSTEYHGAERKSGHYAIEPDGSLEPNPGDEGIEFISPPLPLSEILADLKDVRDWAKSRGCYTGKQYKTGLHINVSTANFKRDALDYVKLVLMLGDDYILKQFERQAVFYCASGLEKVEQLVRRKPELVGELLDSMKQGLSSLASQSLHGTMTDKYTSANVKETHVEFRSPGGDWLNDEVFNKIESSVTRFIVTLDSAMSPEKDRKEYLKKLHRLLTQTEVEKKFDPVTGKTQVVPKGRGYTKTGHEYVVARYLAGELSRSQLFVALGKELPKDMTDRGEWEDGNYEVYDLKRNLPIYRYIANTPAEAEKKYEAWLTDQGYPINNNVVYYRPIEGKHFNPDTNSLTQQSQARGSDNLPAGNRRWLIKDQSGQEVYSFVHRDNTADAQGYAIQWLERNIPDWRERTYHVEPVR